MHAGKYDAIYRISHFSIDDCGINSLDQAARHNRRDHWVDGGSCVCWYWDVVERCSMHIKQADPIF